MLAISQCVLSRSCQPTAGDSSWTAVPYALLKGKFLDPYLAGKSQFLIQWEFFMTAVYGFTLRFIWCLQTDFPFPEDVVDKNGDSL